MQLPSPRRRPTAKSAKEMPLYAETQARFAPLRTPRPPAHRLILTIIARLQTHIHDSFSAFLHNHHPCPRRTTNQARPPGPQKACPAKSAVGRIAQGERRPICPPAMRAVLMLASPVSQVRRKETYLSSISQHTSNPRLGRGIITARPARDQKPPKAKYKDRQRAGLHSVLPRLLADAVRSMGRLFIAGAPIFGENGRVWSEASRHPPSPQVKKSGASGLGGCRAPSEKSAQNDSHPDSRKCPPLP